MIWDFLKIDLILLRTNFGLEFVMGLYWNSGLDFRTNNHAIGTNCFELVIGLEFGALAKRALNHKMGFWNCANIC